MSMYTVDVYSGSSDSIIRDSHAQGVIVKATQGTGYVNPRCNAQYALAKSLGKKLGLYHYAGGGNPESEAQYFINNIKNYVGTAVLILDWESYQNASWGNTNWARRFVNEVHRLTSVWPLIYVQESALWQVANCANTCGVWVAKYASMNWYSWNLPNMRVSSGAFGALTGWQFTGGDMDRSIFYIDSAAWDKIANPNAVHTGWSQHDGKWSYTDPSTGKKVTNWNKIDNRWYCMDDSGNALTGWQKIGDKWYYMDPTNAWCLTGWQKINGHWYYMDPTNAWCLTGWNKINNQWYYMDPENAWCDTGWQKIDGKWYYFDPNNAWMVKGTQTIDGKSYTFDDSGAWVEPKPVQKTEPKPVKPVQPTQPSQPVAILSESDKKAIEDDLKPFIKDEIKKQLENH